MVGLTEDDWLLIAPPIRDQRGHPHPHWPEMRLQRRREWHLLFRADTRWYWWARFDPDTFQWKATWDGWDNPPDPAALVLLVAALRAEMGEGDAVADSAAPMEGDQRTGEAR